jgi:hypothetical protein
MIIFSKKRGIMSEFIGIWLEDGASELLPKRPQFSPPQQKLYYNTKFGVTK